MNALRLSARPVGRRFASSTAAPPMPKQPVPVSVLSLSIVARRRTFDVLDFSIRCAVDRRSVGESFGEYALEDTSHRVT